MTTVTHTQHHLVTAHVENKAGVLLRVAGLFSRRGYNIISLAVAPTDDERFSRISIVVDIESNLLQQVIDQLDKLVNVVEISELDPANAKTAELLLVTVDSELASDAELGELVASSGAVVVERSETKTMLRLVAEPVLLDDFERKLRSYKICELQRTGAVALPRLSGVS
ncbi:MAG TPA: acetolactate synthase small subunit [Acidimicrobiales bacterium]|nr:acetolactate synthase small subunit [Acidimicrobiales bacterium]